MQLNRRRIEVPQTMANVLGGCASAACCLSAQHWVGVCCHVVVLPLCYDDDMAFQFSTRTMLLATTCIAVVLASLIAWSRVLQPSIWSNSSVTAEVVHALIALSPVWGPLVWVAYAIGRRHLTVAFAVAFTVFEAVTTIAAVWIIVR